MDPPAPRPPAQAKNPAAASVAPASVNVVTARDKAIVDALKIRPWPQESLYAVMPTEEALTDAERRAAFESALIRLRVKKVIKQVPEGWAAI